MHACVCACTRDHQWCAHIRGPLCYVQILVCVCVCASCECVRACACVSLFLSRCLCLCLCLCLSMHIPISDLVYVQGDHSKKVEALLLKLGCIKGVSHSNIAAALPVITHACTRVHANTHAHTHTHAHTRAHTHTYSL